MLLTMVAVAGTGYAADEPASLGTQAGEAARDLKGTAGETLSAGAIKVADSSKKIQTEAQDTLKTLREQWDVLAKQLQEKTQQISKQLQASAAQLSAQAQKQLEDFNKSFNKPKS